MRVRQDAATGRLGIARKATGVTLILLGVAIVSAQPSPLGPRSLAVAVSSLELRVDDFDDPAWQTAPGARDLIQQEPEEGLPATLGTECRILATPRALLLRFVMEEPAAEFVAHELRRDADLSADDRISLVIDTYHDRRNAYFFSTNPNGVRVDGLVTEESDPSLDWDTVWDVAVRRTATGWEAIFRIPFSALNFAGGAGESWGFNFSRDLRRRTESDRWTGWKPPFTLSKISQAGELTGIPPMPSRRLRSLTPFVAGAVERRDGHTDTDLLGRAGLDFRYGINSSTEADLTVNTDFAETETDAQQFNFGRSALFFPEKRLFFLQRSQVFAFGNPNTTLPFFSRRIGLSNDEENPTPIPIDAGLKLTGRLGSTDFGALAVQTREAAGEPRTDSFVGRVKQDLGHASYVGALFTDIERAAGSTLSRYSRTYGADAAVSLTPEWNASGYYAKTDNPGVTGHTDAWNAALSYNGEYANGRVERGDIGSSYDPELGFVTQNGIHSTFADVEITPRPHVLGLQRLGFESFYSFLYNEDGSLHEREYQYTFRALWQNGAYSDNDIVDVFDENLTDPLKLTDAVTIPVGLYHFARHQIAAGTNPSRAVAFQVNVNFGDYYGGTRNQYTGRVFLKPNEHLGISIIETYNVVRLSEGSFNLSLFSGRVDWNPSVRLLSSVIVQSDNVDRLTNIQAIVRWLFDSATEVFLVYNRQIGAGFERPGTRVTLKVRRTFDL